ncbi:MAG: DUF2783 domain-containing protein [Azospirillaceae bacterium]
MTARRPLPTLRTLTVEDNFAGRGDDVYAALMAAHEGLSAEDSARLDRRLVLLLANHVGDTEAITEAITIARAAVERADGS